MKDVDRQLKIGAIISYIIIAFNIITGVWYSPWLLKMIGDSDYGMYTVATSLISVFLLDFGVRSSVSRYVSKYRAENRQDQIDSFLGLICKVFFTIDLVICIILIVVYKNLAKIYVEFSAEELSKFKIIYLIVAIYSIIQFPFTNLDGILYSYERFIVIKFSELMQKVICMGIMIAVLLNGGGLFELVIVNSCTALGISFIKLFYLKKTTSIHVRLHGIGRGFIKEILLFSLWTTLISIMQRLFYNVMPSVIAMKLGSGAVPFFSFSSLLEGYVYTIGNAIGGFFISRLSRFNAESNRDEISKLMCNVGKFQLAIIGLIVTGFVCLGDVFVKEIWLGEEYFLVYYGAIILMVLHIMTMPEQVADVLIIVQNKVRYKAYIMILGGMVNILLAFLLIDLVGVIGACISIFISNIVIYILTNIFYIKKMQIDIISFWKKVYWPILPVQIVVMLVGRWGMKYININGYFGFLIKGFAFVLFYLLSLFIVLNKEDRNFFTNILKRKNKRGE